MCEKTLSCSSTYERAILNRTDYFYAFFFFLLTLQWRTLDRNFSFILIGTQVSWVRYRDVHILAVGAAVFTSDARWKDFFICENKFFSAPYPNRAICLVCRFNVRYIEDEGR